jgi:hypothetical protein
MFPAFLLHSFPLWFFMSVAGGLALTVIGSRRKLYPSGGVQEADEGARSAAMLALTWSVAMGIFILITTDLLIYSSFVVLLIPIAVCFAPMLAESAQRFVVASAVCAMILGILSFVAGFSIGTAYGPAAGLLFVASLTGFLRRGKRWTST